MVQQTTTQAKRTDPATELSVSMREVIRMLKSVRKMGDEMIADSGGYTSRQVFSNRLSGKTPFTEEDFGRVAAALRVHPTVLLMSLKDALEWVQQNRDYKPPKFRKQSAGSPRPSNRGMRS